MLASHVFLTGYGYGVYGIGLVFCDIFSLSCSFHVYMLMLNVAMIWS